MVFTIKEWSKLWLNYEKRELQNEIPEQITVCDFSLDNAIIRNAVDELICGIEGMAEITLKMTDIQTEKAICIRQNKMLIKESYHLYNRDGSLVIEAADANGVLYGAFSLLRQISMGKDLLKIDILESPENPLRMYNHWDNMDGSIERGYSGNSFFFEQDEIIFNDRIRDYARLIASVGINGIVINNVNVKQAATWLITDRYFNDLKKYCDLFESYGIKLFLSLNFAASMELGGPQSADPLDEEVIEWWRAKIEEVYKNLPTLGGFLVKADSEGRPGPFTYGRTQADGANMLADIIKPYGGLIIWRCFVYNCTQDWRDKVTDRARAGYDNFMPMDGTYHENVILQIKNGPMDFQVREPVSPLLGGLRKTNQMLEVQIAQEYTGQQIDVCYLIPLFKEVLNFKTYCKEKDDTVADIISGRTYGNTNTGIAAVCNTGNDANWTGSFFAAANLYGFGRLAFRMDLSAEEIAEEWIRQSVVADDETVAAIKQILLVSREVYEKYTCPLGIGWMVTPHIHYGCSVDGYEYSRWGTYHRADHKGIGVDRSHNGTGYAMQYYSPNAEMFDKMDTCPEELLLFFHHVPYTYELKSNKTLIQHIYDSHYEGVEQVEAMIATWNSLKDKLPMVIWENGMERFERQLYNAKEWRDQVNVYFYRKSGIPDVHGRVTD